MKTILSIVLASILLTSCSSTTKLPSATGTNQSELLVGNWKVETAYVAGEKKANIISGVSIQFHDDSSFNGQAPCNRMSGQSIISTGGKIVLSQILTTKMACPDIKLEGYLLNVLENSVRRFSVVDNKLYLANDKKEVLFIASKIQ